MKKHLVKILIGLIALLGGTTAVLGARTSTTGGTATGLAAASTAISPFYVTSQDAGASGAELDLFQNSSSPAVLDAPGLIVFYGNNASSTKVEYARFSGGIYDPTTGSHDGFFLIQTAQNGDTVNNRAIFYGNGSQDVGIVGFNQEGLITSWTNQNMTIGADYDPVALTYSPYMFFNTSTDEVAINTTSTGATLLVYDDGPNTGAEGIFITTPNASPSYGMGNSATNYMVMYFNTSTADIRYNIYNGAMYQDIMRIGTSTITMATTTITNFLNVSAGTTSTFANGINLSSGCFAVGGTCITGGSGTPGGSDTQLQYNNGGAFGGTTLSYYDDKQEFSASTTMFRLINTTDDNFGSALRLVLNSATPTSTDKLGVIEFGGNTTSTEEVDYGYFYGLGDPETGVGSFSFDLTPEGGTDPVPAMQLSFANFGSGAVTPFLELFSADILNTDVGIMAGPGSLVLAGSKNADVYFQVNGGDGIASELVSSLADRSFWTHSSTATTTMMFGNTGTDGTSAYCGGHAALDTPTVMVYDYYLAAGTHVVTTTNPCGVTMPVADTEGGS